MKDTRVLLGVCVMGIKEQKAYDIYQRLMAGDLKLTEASRLVGKSTRQVQRTLARVKRFGMRGVLHGNLGKVPVNKTSVALKNSAMSLLGERYFDFNITHFKEKLSSEHGINISHDILLRWGHEKHLVKRAHHRKRSKLHRTRVRMPRAGMLLQMDGSHHRWFGPQGIESCIVGNIDDATSSCCEAEFFPGEDTFSVLTVMKNTIEKFGVPEVLYLDQAGFHGKIHPRAKIIDWQKHLTHLERAMGELGVRVLFATSPQAKGRVERMWNTFQDRLIPELRIRNIQRIPTANLFLKNHFVPEFNQRFQVPAHEPLRPGWQPIPENFKGQLREIFCLREWRVVTPGDTISWEGKTYSVGHDYNYSLRGLQIELRTYLDQTWAGFHANKPVKLNEFVVVKKIAA